MFVCDICGNNYYKNDIKKSKCSFLAHIQSHGLNKVYFINNIIKYVEIPKCACQMCGLNVFMHGREIKFNLFANDCPNKGRFINPTTLEYYLFNGYSVDESIYRIRKIQSKKISNKHKKILSNKNSGNGNPSSILSISKRTNKSIEQVRNELKENSRKGVNNPFYGKKHSADTLKKLAISKSNIPKIVTKPELILYGVLCGLGINFEYQVPIGIYVVDFLIGNCILEVYGDYWHSKSMKSRDSQKIKDEIKEEYFVKGGYNFIVIWESELINNHRKVINEIKKIKQN